MAQKTVLELVDDLDGGPADETVAFAIDGVEFVIDLSAENASRLRDVLAEFVGHARRIGGRKTRGAGTSTSTSGNISASPSSSASGSGSASTNASGSTSAKPANTNAKAAPAKPAYAVVAAPHAPANGKPDTQAVREWARSQGETVAERGRVPQALLIKFQEAHA